MLIYLKQAWEARLAAGQPRLRSDLDEAIREGAVLRMRPKAMTVCVIVAGLLPIMWSHGTGSEVMQRIAAPMIGGMITAPLLSLFVVPAVFAWMRRSNISSGEQRVRLETRGYRWGYRAFSPVHLGRKKAAPLAVFNSGRGRHIGFYVPRSSTTVAAISHSRLKELRRASVGIRP